MKTLFFVLGFAFCCQVFSQNTFIDSRDNQEYQIAEIQGLKWMLNDLNYVTELSFDLTAEQRERTGLPKARWYHFLELAEVCPEGWRLPTVEEWIGYFQHFASQYEAKLKVRSHKETLRVWDFPAHLL